MSLINERVRELRKELGFTQEKYSKMLGIKRCTLASYEESRALPPINLIPKIMETANIPMEDMYDFLFDAGYSTYKIKYDDQVPVQDSSASN